jgi:hypothetical protein
VANAAKVQTALKLSEEDQMTIRSLKKEIEKAWKMVDASHEKEARAKETISHLKMEISNLTRLVEQGAGISLGEESTVNELLKQKDELVKELDLKVIFVCFTILLQTNVFGISSFCALLAIIGYLQWLSGSLIGPCEPKDCKGLASICRA